MPKSFLRFILPMLGRCWSMIVNAGVYPGMPFIESRRTRLLNLLAVPCIPFISFYAVLNTVQGRYLLAALNFTMALSCVAVLLLHRGRRYLSARMVLIVFSVIVYTFTGLFYHNGAEYFLLNILFISLLVYDNKWTIAVLSLLIISAFLFIVLVPQHWRLAEPVPRERAFGNIATSLLFVVIGLTFFKRIQTDYQAEIEKQRRELADMNQDKEKLFSIVAHDIRSPLVTLEVLLDMFHKGQYPGNSMMEAAIGLHKQVAGMRGTLDNVLRWSMRNMKGIHNRPEHFPLLPLLGEVSLFLQLVQEQKDIEIVLEVPEDLLLFADRDQVSVILRNLVSNALKFSYPGSSVLVKAQAQAQGVRISVSDQGVGMSAQQLDNLFSGRRNPGSGTGGERGAGLGLLLSREFAQRNGGHLQASSTPGKGATFVVELPAGCPEAYEETLEENLAGSN